MLAAKHVQRQVTVAVVVTVEEAAQLMTVQRIVGRVEVQHDLLGRPRSQPQERIHQERLDSSMPGRNLLVAARHAGTRRRQFQPVERALAGQRDAPIARVDPVLARRITTADQHRQQRITPQLLVVVEVLVAQT